MSPTVRWGGSLGFFPLRQVLFAPVLFLDFGIVGLESIEPNLTPLLLATVPTWNEKPLVGLREELFWQNLLVRQNVLEVLI